MNKAIAILCVVMPALAASGCQDESRAQPIEVIVVSEQLAGGARYNIDLTRDDAVYFLAPGLDASRLSVTCPTLSTISFAEYFISRIRPLGTKYNPASDAAQLANALVPREAMSNSIDAYSWTCTYVFMDGYRGEDWYASCYPEPGDSYPQGDPEP